MIIEKLRLVIRRVNSAGTVKILILTFLATCSYLITFRLLPARNAIPAGKQVL